MLELTDIIDRTFHRAGIRPPLWDTGTTYDVPLRHPLSQDASIDQAVRFCLIGPYAQYQRMYFYAWGDPKLALVLQVGGGRPTPAAVAVDRLQRALRGAHITGCAHGRGAGLPGNTYRCTFTKQGNDVSIWWTDRGTAPLPAQPSPATATTIDGIEHRTDRPLLVTDRPLILSRANH